MMVLQCFVSFRFVVIANGKLIYPNKGWQMNSRNEIRPRCRKCKYAKCQPTSAHQLISSRRRHRRRQQHDTGDDTVSVASASNSNIINYPAKFQHCIILHRIHCDLKQNNNSNNKLLYMFIDRHFFYVSTSMRLCCVFERKRWKKRINQIIQYILNKNGRKKIEVNRHCIGMEWNGMP